MKNTNELIHEYLDAKIQNDWICVDMTCGHGYDTLFMAQRAQKVYSFDIQQAAIDSAQEKTKDLTNINYILASHQNVDQTINFLVNCVIFNLGYLPGGDKSIKTSVDSTLQALNKIDRWIVKEGLLIVTCYRGHPGGQEEYEAVVQWLDQHQYYEVTTLDYGNKIAPIAYLCVNKKL